MTIGLLRPREAEEEAENDSLEYAHGTVMVIAWIVFGSSAVLFARYGRWMQFGSMDKCLGEKIWFQFHRLIACLTTIATLVGFFLILAYTGGTWVESDEGPEFAHSVLGGIVLVCALIQPWMAVFRCHPEGRFRFIYNWMHRFVGGLAFLLSIPTIFIIVAKLEEKNNNGMIVIMAIWSAWVVLIVLLLEILRFRQQNAAPATLHKRDRSDLYNINESNGHNTSRSNVRPTPVGNNLILILFVLNIIVSIALAIPLIVLIWK